jgi:hypothetical protein
VAETFEHLDGIGARAIHALGRSLFRGVCAENFVRIDLVSESLDVSDDGCAGMLDFEAVGFGGTRLSGPEKRAFQRDFRFQVQNFFRAQEIVKLSVRDGD